MKKMKMKIGGKSFCEDGVGKEMWPYYPTKWIWKFEFLLDFSTTKIQNLISPTI